ncbi:MAG: hypothetical protein KDB80_11815 [Planctomycetes bacterium]|nr:hypothetical protein [Planctomycetota bacterium]
MIRTLCLSGLLLSVLASCQTSWTSYYFSSRTGDAIVESHGGRVFQVAWFHDGHLYGADAMSHPDCPLRDMLGNGEAVDHPNLATWREQLREMQELASRPDTSPDRFLGSVRGCRFDGAVEHAVETWVANDPSRAAMVLDALPDVELTDRYAETLTSLALANPADDARLARWARSLLAEDHENAIARLLEHESVGPATSRAVLHDLDELRSKDRERVFAAAARHVASDPDAAFLIVDAVDELPSSGEVPALMEALDANPSTALARQVLRTIDDRISNDRLQLFQRAAALVMTQPGCHYTIVDGLDELLSKHRLPAAEGLATDPNAPAELVVMLVDHTDELLLRDRAPFLLAVLDGPHGQVPAVRRACRHAAEEELPLRDRKFVLGRLED